jgi:hypothetical protein
MIVVTVIFIIVIPPVSTGKSLGFSSWRWEGDESHSSILYGVVIFRKGDDMLFFGPAKSKATRKINQLCSVTD